MATPCKSLNLDICPDCGSALLYMPDINSADTIMYCTTCKRHIKDGQQKRV